jgi:hypothetical protein
MRCKMNKLTLLESEVLNDLRTVDLPIMLPVPDSFHTFPHRPLD